MRLDKNGNFRTLRISALCFVSGLFQARSCTVLPLFTSGQSWCFLYGCSRLWFSCGVHTWANVFPTVWWRSAASWLFVQLSLMCIVFIVIRRHRNTESIRIKYRNLTTQKYKKILHRTVPKLIGLIPHKYSEYFSSYPTELFLVVIVLRKFRLFTYR